MPSERVGKIIVSEELLLKMFDFYPGKIRRINLGRWNEVEVIIEHPDMPEVKEGEPIPDVMPLYMVNQDALGHKVTIRQREGG